MFKRNDGFTLVELLVVICVVFSIVTISNILFFGNFWYLEEGVLKEIKTDHPGVTDLLKTKRNVFDKSVITVKEDGVRHDYCLDTSISFNYEFSEC